MPKAAAESEEASDVLRIAVVGAGTMGQGIAQVASQAGIDVLIIEKDEDSLKESLASIEDHLDYETSRWSKTESDKRAILSRIQGSSETADAAEEPIVIDELPDNLAVKKEVFSRMDKICQPDAIFITNTSTLSITEIAASWIWQRRVSPERSKLFLRKAEVMPVGVVSM